MKNLIINILTKEVISIGKVESLLESLLEYDNYIYMYIRNNIINKINFDNDIIEVSIIIDELRAILSIDFTN